MLIGTVWAEQSYHDTDNEANSAGLARANGQLR